MRNPATSSSTAAHEVFKRAAADSPCQKILQGFVRPSVEEQLYRQMRAEFGKEL
jgi:hypothetical protein